MHKLIGGTRAQFRTCKAHYLARSVGRPKRRYTGNKLVMYADDTQLLNGYGRDSLQSHLAVLEKRFRVAQAWFDQNGFKTH